MKRTFTARVWPEGDWHIAQALEIDIASQGESEREALCNLQEAIELYYEEAQSPNTENEQVHSIHKIEVEVGEAVSAVLGVGSEAD